MKYIIGIDEVGRGCLAGPVTVAAVAMPEELRTRNHELGKLRDSKKLTAKQRESWFEWVRAHPKICYARANVYPKIIDRINISKAANLAATRAFRKLAASHLGVATEAKVFLDGGLYLSINPKFYVLNSRTIAKGDEKYNCVKLASIVAKVNRDRLLGKYHKKYPAYGFGKHKGYGTKKHIAAIKQFGACSLHRLTFIKNFC